MRLATVPSLTGTCLAVLALAGPAAAQNVVLQNDSVTDFSSVVIQAGFASNERAASWLTATCSGELTSVRIFWQSLTGGAPASLQDSINISEPGVFPEPGSLIRSLSGPQLIDGVLNEFSLVPAVPITDGEQVVVDMRFLDGPPATGPSVVTDSDGCQANSNAVFAIPPGLWIDPCLLGISGDFVIRAVLQCNGMIFDSGFETGTLIEWDETAE